MSEPPTSADAERVFDPLLSTLRFTVHDGVPQAEGAIVDRGIGESTDLAAPLHEVRPISFSTTSQEPCP